MSRFTIKLIVLLTAAGLLSASELPGRGWTLGTSIGVHWGGAREIVYDNSGVENQNDYLSLLTWDLQPVVTIGIESRWESGKSGGLDLNLRSGISGMPVGEMWDYDWLTVNDSRPTYWSVSDIRLRWGFIFDVGYDWNLISTGIFSFNTGVGYHFDWWAWRDITKDSSYGVPVGVSAIDYSVIYNVPVFSLKIRFTGRVSYLKITSRVGPVLAFAHDHHKLRIENGNVDGLNFYDNAFGGPWLDIAISGGFHSHGNFSFEIIGEYAWLNETKGDSLTVYSDGLTPSTLSEDAAGFAFSRIGVTALFSWDLRGP